MPCSGRRQPPPSKGLFLQYNGFKIALGQDTLIRVLNDLVHPGADNAEEVAGEQA
jgi:hypothetical protein